MAEPGGSHRAATPDTSHKRQFAIAVVITFGLLLLSFPVARAVDSHIDRQRAMFEDVALMSLLQYRLIRDEGRGKPLEMHEGDKVTIVGYTFTPEPGVSVWVKTKHHGKGYCVRATNQYGDKTGWRCGTGAKEPRPAPNINGTSSLQ